MKDILSRRSKWIVSASRIMGRNYLRLMVCFPARSFLRGNENITSLDTHEIMHLGSVKSIRTKILSNSYVCTRGSRRTVQSMFIETLHTTLVNRFVEK